MVRIRDAYDDAVDWLCEHRGDIRAAWFNFNTHHAGFLFAMASDDRLGSGMCGCLTMIDPCLQAWFAPRLYVLRELKGLL